MKNTAGEKVKKIIREEFDSRMEMAIVTYILDKGWDSLKKVTDEDIAKVEGNAFMTQEFCQALVRVAVRICKECNQIDDFLPFIVNHLYVPNAEMKEYEIYRSSMSCDQWRDFIELFNIEEDDEEFIDMVVLNANVIETVNFDL